MSKKNTGGTLHEKPMPHNDRGARAPHYPPSTKNGTQGTPGSTDDKSGRGSTPSMPSTHGNAGGPGCTTHRES